MNNEEITRYILETFNDGNEVKANTKYTDNEIERCIHLLAKNNCIIDCYQDVLGNYCAEGLTSTGKELLNKLRA